MRAPLDRNDSARAASQYGVRNHACPLAGSDPCENARSRLSVLVASVRCPDWSRSPSVRHEAASIRDVLPTACGDGVFRPGQHHARQAPLPQYLELGQVPKVAPAGRHDGAANARAPRLGR